MSLLSRAIEPNNLRLLFSLTAFVDDVAQELRDDARFGRVVLRALAWKPARDARPEPIDPFPPRAPLEVPALRGKRVGVVASGGSGALASLVGVQRALEEAGVQVSAIAACSGAVLFAAPWAFGASAEENARFWLGARTRDYVDPGFARALVAAARGLSRFGGVLRGRAVEALFRARFGEAKLGDARVPLFVPAWSIDDNRLEYFGSTTMPELSLATTVHLATAIPIFTEPVRIRGRWYGDGGVVSIFPARPLADFDPPLDVVFGVHCYFPQGFAGESVAGWYERSAAILRASMQVRTCVSLELAREQARLLGDRLTMLHPVPYQEIAGGKFYEAFLDRTRWPDYMRAGRDAARAALAGWQRAMPRGAYTAIPSQMAMIR